MISIKEWLQKLGESFFALFKVFVLSKFRTQVKYLTREREMLILGNGPSLNTLINNANSFLNDKDLLCVNFFPLTDFYHQLKPSYYITSAPELWIDNVNDNYVQKREALFKVLGEKTEWPLTLLIPFSARRFSSWQQAISKNLNIQVVYYNDIGIEGFDGLLFKLFKRNLAMPRPHNVIIPAIFSAINLGYKNIYLWGTENNQFLELSIDENNNALINHKHYYDENESKAKVMTKLGSGQRKVHEILHKFMLTFKGYHVLNNYALTRNAKVINQTPGSLIDAFERERFTS